MKKQARRIPKEDLKKEIIGGITTFLTMSYIIVLNPAILSSPGTGMSFNGVMTATVLLSFFSTLLMGLYAKLPYGVAPGMGINAFFTFSLILGQKIPFPTALGLVFWAGVIFLILSVLPVRTKLAEAIPESLRQAAAVGIGLFLAFIGFKNAGVIVANPETLVHMGPINTKVLLACLGMLVMIVGLSRKNAWTFIFGMALVTLISVLMGMVPAPSHFVAMPDFESVMFKLDFAAILQFSLWPAILAICFTDLFDSISTFVGVSTATGLVDEKKRPLRLKEGLIVDAFATLGAGLLGTSSGTAFIESSAGIEAGGRTGKSALVTAFCFLPFLFLSPIAGLVPMWATAPVLVLVGAMMFRSVGTLFTKEWEDLIPAFLTIVLIPLTFSITQGMLWGFVAHVVLYVIAGRARQVSPMMYGIGVLSVFMLWLGSH